jgi:hypothetical protein
MTLNKKREQMLCMVLDWRNSGLSQMQYVKQHGIHINKLRYWIRKHNNTTQKDQESAFIALPNILSQEISVHYPNGIEIKLPSQISACYLRELIQA